jgi:hypothetical protein
MHKPRFLLARTMESKKIGAIQIIANWIKRKAKADPCSTPNKLL